MTGAQHSAQIKPRSPIIPASDTLLHLFGVAEQTKASLLPIVSFLFTSKSLLVYICVKMSRFQSLRCELLLILLHVGERNTLLQFPPTVPCDQPFLSRLQSIYPSPSCAPRPPPSSHSTAETIINYPYPSALSTPQSPSFFPGSIQQSGSFWLAVGATQPRRCQSPRSR